MRLRVLNPCHEDFDAMEGDARKRFCATCSTHVHVLSEMTRSEAEAFMAAQQGRDVCVRYLQGPSGEIRFRPSTTTWGLGFVAALSLAMAACTGHLEADGLDAPDVEAVCRDANGYAVDCEELEYGAFPDAPEADPVAVVDVDDEDVDDEPGDDVARVPPSGGPDPPVAAAERDVPRSCPIPGAAPKTRKQARRKRRASRRGRRGRSRANGDTMGVLVMGR